MEPIGQLGQFAKQEFNTIHFYDLTLADPDGAETEYAPYHSGPKFFIFMQIFGKDSDVGWKPPRSV